ncbi:hypothetical protein CBS101457_006351 [Exobasidium rhododendri]|nr:hypothetical protein CBS101457_006351 [Exobasidium rhododendri]
MHAKLILLCLLVAAVSAHQASLPRPTSYMVKKSIRLHRRQFSFFSDSSDSASTSTDSGSGSDTSDGSGPSSSAAAATSSSSSSSSRSDPTSSSQSAPSSPSNSASSISSSSPSTTSAAGATSTSGSGRGRTTSFQSTFTASNSAVVSSSTNAAGSVVILTSTVQEAIPTTTAPLASSTESAASDTESSGSHTGLIVGVSVVGGVAIIGALIFLYMKFGGKRFSDFHDEDADIKWPELKAEGDSAALQPLPARRTGGAGFEMSNEFDDGPEGDNHSMTEYGYKGSESMAGSNVALNTGVGAGQFYPTGGNGGAGMENAEYYDDTPSANNPYSQPISGYQDLYSGYSAGQGQTAYLDQTHEATAATTPSSAGQQYDGYQDYHNQSDPYGAARAQSASISPPMQPYRIGGQSMHQNF